MMFYSPDVFGAQVQFMILSLDDAAAPGAPHTSPCAISAVLHPVVLVIGHQAVAVVRQSSTGEGTAMRFTFFCIYDILIVP